MANYDIRNIETNTSIGYHTVTFEDGHEVEVADWRLMFMKDFKRSYKAAKAVKKQLKREGKWDY